MTVVNTARRQRIGRWILRVGLTASMVILILWQVPPRSVLDTLFELEWQWLVLAVLLTLVINLLRPWRWLWLLRAVEPETTFWQALGSMLVAASARLVLPGRVGEYGRVFTLRKLSLKRALGLTTVDLLIEIQTGLLCALPAAMAFGGLGATLPLLLLLAIVFASCHRPDVVLRGAGRLLGSKRLREHATAARQVMDTLSGATLLRANLLTLLMHALRFLQLAVLLVALSVSPSLRTWFILPLVQLADAVPLTVAGIGPREWVGLKVLPWAAVPPAVAVTAVLLQSVISGFVPGGLGLFFVLRGTGRAPRPAAQPTTAR